MQEIKITFTKAEVRIARFIAKQIQATNEAHNIQSNKHASSASDTGIHMQGIIGELAVCKFLNLCPSMECEPQSAKSGTDKGDVILHDGRIVDVKYTRYPDGRLLVGEGKKRAGADLYILVTRVTGERAVILRGWASREQIFQGSNYNESMRCYELSQSELNPLSTLAHKPLPTPADLNVSESIARVIPFKKAQQ